MKYNNFIYDGTVFYLPAKCANTSIKNCLMEHGNLGKDHFKQKSIYLSPRDIYREHQDKPSIIVVRNPYDRVVSCYENKVNGLRPYVPLGQWVKHMTSFDKFIDFLSTQSSSQCNIHIAPYYRQSYWNDKRLPHRVIYFENLNEEWEALGYGKLPEKNVSDRKPWQEYYTDEQKEVVYNFYKRDFEDYDYER